MGHHLILHRAPKSPANLEENKRRFLASPQEKNITFRKHRLDTAFFVAVADPGFLHRVCAAKKIYTIR
jgi:hypothetical protein